MNQQRRFSAVIVIISINIVVFALTIIMPQIRNLLAMIPKAVVEYGYYWQVVTYMFVHSPYNFTHILMNLLALFIFGVSLETRMGTREFTLFYMISGIFAGIFSLGFYYATGLTTVALVGASGAVFAVLFAFACFFPDSRIYIFGILPVRSPILVLGYAAIEVFSVLFSRNTGVAHFTHLSGLIVAIAYFLIRYKVNPFKIFSGKIRL